MFGRNGYLREFSRDCDKKHLSNLKYLGVNDRRLPGVWKVNLKLKQETWAYHQTGFSSRGDPSTSQRDASPFIIFVQWLCSSSINTHKKKKNVTPRMTLTYMTLKSIIVSSLIVKGYSLMHL